MSSLVLAPIIGIGIGLALGMLGGGGSILTVPALVYLLGQDAHTAVGTSLVIVGTNALAGAWMHYRAGHVQVQRAFIFALAGLGAAYGGARLSQYLPSEFLLMLFALLMIMVALLMLRHKPTHANEQQNAPLAWPKMLLGGFGVGFLTGFLGVGGGFIIVPALVLLLGMDMRSAVGSSLVVIALNSGAGIIGHLHDSALSWNLIGLMIAGGMIGIITGTWGARRLQTAYLRRGFAVMVIILGITLLGINLPIILA